jgi:hypothetical protein
MTTESRDTEFRRKVTSGTHVRWGSLLNGNEAAYEHGSALNRRCACAWTLLPTQR